MKKKMNNKGFSLVELIIVIAIMLVLVGILAPQFVKYVARSRVAADVTNAQEIAAAIDVAIADPQLTYAETPAAGATDVWGGIKSDTAYPGGTAVVGIAGFTTIPASRVDSSRTWTITFDTTNGVTKITLGGAEIYPTATAYEALD